MLCQYFDLALTLTNGPNTYLMFQFSDGVLKRFILLMVWLFCLFYRRFGTKCGGCGQGISPNDLVRRARNKVFHLKCFTCMVCRKQLSTGEELYVLDENKFICKEDYLSSKFQGKN